MKSRVVHLRAALVPLGVAFVLIAALAWCELTKDRRIIARQAPASLKLARANQLPDVSQQSGTASQPTAKVFNRLVTRTVGEVAGTLYTLYLQPVQLSLTSFGSEESEEWECSVGMGDTGDLVGARDGRS